MSLTNEAKALSRLGELRRGKTVFQDMVWPGLDLPFKLQVLTDSEQQECLADAHRRFERLNIPIGPMTIDDFESEIVVQVLHRACRDPETPWDATFAASADDLRENVNARQRQAVFDCYVDLQERHNPRAGAISAELHAEILEAVKKKDRSRLREFGSDSLASFLLTSAAPLSS